MTARRVIIAQPYRCTRRACTEPYQSAGARMWQDGRAFLCEPCHEAATAEKVCPVCDGAAGDRADGCCSRKCARRLERDAGRHAEAG